MITEITLGRSKTDTDWSRRATLDLFDRLSKSPPGPKDGECFTPAVFRGSERHLTDADRIGVAMLDSDCGHELFEIAAAIDAAGYEALIHSTHSHLTNQTEISRRKFDGWKKDAGLGDVVVYMRKTKGYLPHIVKGAKIVGKNFYEKNYIVEHRPCPRFRIAILLASPWRAADFVSQVVAKTAWRRFIVALAGRLNLHHDQSCTDDSRLFFFPRTRPGGPEFKYWHCYGQRRAGKARSPSMPRRTWLPPTCRNARIL
jgi:hypothetical protein